jgi:hypothetical protein
MMNNDWNPFPTTNELHCNDLAGNLCRADVSSQAVQGWQGAANVPAQSVSEHLSSDIYIPECYHEVSMLSSHALTGSVHRLCS